MAILPTSENFPAHPSERNSALGASWTVTLFIRRVVRDWIVTLRQGLPLFHREMLAQSYRTRTYFLRALFAVALFFSALIYTAVETRTSFLTADVQLLGRGRVILDGLVWMLFVFIYVFAPAISSGVITQEKERQTLILLFLTKLTPWHVVLEKFLSRLLPTLHILLLSMPLLVFAYVFGGVSTEMLATSMWYLFVTTIQVTAVAVFCSTLCRHTTKAFLLTYGALILLYFGPVIGEIWIINGQVARNFLDYSFGADSAIRPVPPSGPPISVPSFPALNATQATPVRAVAIPPELMPLAAFPPALFAHHYRPGVVGTAFTWNEMLLGGIPTLVSAAVCLLLARCFVYYRAFEDSRSLTLRQLAAYWTHFQFAIQGRGRMHRASMKVASEEPIAWRERLRGSGSILPILLILEIPTLVALFWLARNGDSSSESISAVIFVLWAVAVMLICVHSATLVNKERTLQTLELLLTTPLTSEEIVQQKFNGTRRLMFICAIPLLTCIVFQCWWRTLVAPPPVVNEVGFIWWEYLITASSCVLIYFQLAGWIALWAGLRNKSPSRATLEAFGCVAFSCVVPQVVILLPLACLIPVNLLLSMNLAYVLLAQLSPVIMIMVGEFANWRDLCSIPLLPVIANILIYWTALSACRRFVLDRADVLLGRTVHY